VRTAQVNSILQKPTYADNLSSVSLNEVIAELPRLTFEERQILIRKALELDDPPLSVADEALIEERLAEHRANSDSSMPLNEVKTRLRSR
jgi:hypothetical protein